MPRALPPRSSVHRGACCLATLATCPANSCRPLLPAAPPPPLPLVRRRRPPRAPITCSTRVIVRSPCSGAANPWSAWRGCASAPMLAPSPLNPLALRAASSTSLQPCRGSLPATPPHAPVPAPILLPPTAPPPPCTQVGFGAVFRPPLREPSLTLSLPHRLQAPSSSAQPRPHHGGGADIAVCPASTTARPSHAPRPTPHGPRREAHPLPRDHSRPAQHSMRRTHRRSSRTSASCSRMATRARRRCPSCCGCCSSTYVHCR